MSVHVCVGFSSTAERAPGRETDGTGERPGRPFEELVNQDKEIDGWKDRKAGLNVTCSHLNGDVCRLEALLQTSSEKSQ